MSRWGFQRIVWALAILAFVWVLRAPINQAGSDPRGSLLVAQALIETGSIRLDPYLDAADLPPRVLETQAHRVDYYFPVGTPLVALPAVAPAKLAGLDMADAADEARLHKWLAALSVALALLLVATLAADAVPQWSSSSAGPLAEAAVEGSALLGTSGGAELLLLVLGLSLGTGLASTLGTAFWSNNTAVLANLAILVLVQRWVWPFGASIHGLFAATSGPKALDPSPSTTGLSPARAIAIGALATLSCLARPTGAILFLGLFCLVLWMRKLRSALWLLVVPGLSALAFARFSLNAYGSPTPPYYHPTRLSNTESLPQILYGNVLGPGRGFLVFSPLLLLVLLGAWRYRSALIRQPLAWLAGFWASAHLLAISRFPHWWGGHTFGNRLYLDALPAWILLALLVWRAWRASAPSPAARRSLLWIAAPLSLFGIWVHAWQGLYNLHTVMWNGGDWGEVLGDLNVDEHHEYLFDWRYPQMLAGETMIRERFEEHGLREIPYYPTGRAIRAEDDPRHFDEGWYPVEHPAGAVPSQIPNPSSDPNRNPSPIPIPTWRWSAGQSSIVFRLDPERFPATSDRLQLMIAAGSLDGRPVEMRLNGTPLGLIEPDAHFDPIYTGYFFEPSLLREINHVTFHAQDAHMPAGDSRVLGMVFYEMRLLGEEEWLEPWFANPFRNVGRP